jgi:regulatory protein
MQVTDIQPQKKRQGFFNIFIDGKYSFAISAELLLKHKLKSGLDIGQEKIDKIIKEAEYGKWFDATLNFLSYRPHSQSEVRDYLKRKQVGETVEQAIIEKLIRLKFLDDREFAKWFIEQRQTFRPKGKHLLKLELLNKGISREIIEEALSSTESRTEFEVAKELAQKKLSFLHNYPIQKQREKIVSFLGRRGYSWDVISKVLSNIKLIKYAYERD